MSREFSGARFRAKKDLACIPGCLVSSEHAIPNKASNLVPEEEVIAYLPGSKEHHYDFIFTEDGIVVVKASNVVLQGRYRDIGGFYCPRDKKSEILKLEVTGEEHSLPCVSPFDIYSFLSHTLGDIARDLGQEMTAKGGAWS